MNNITISLSSIENQLLLFDGRLTSIETCLCNMYHVAATQNPSFETSLDTSTTFSVSEFPTDTNVSSPNEPFPVIQFPKDTNLSLIPAGEVVVSGPWNKIQTPPNTKRTATTTPISPLVFRLPQETATNLKPMWKKHEKCHKRQVQRRAAIPVMWPNSLLKILKEHDESLTNSNIVISYSKEP